jgi:phospholipid/cholesterol/gamma-HCH transport system substrate-binding protein
MQSWTTEFKVGLFVILTLIAIAVGWAWSQDGVRPDEESYTLRMSVGSADGLYAGSSVRIAGVDVGSVESITIAGDRAQVMLRIRAAYRLPVDSEGELKAQGLLGDYYVRVYPGVADELLPDQGLLGTRSEPGDIDTITRNLETISDDIAAITKVLRLMAENRDNKDHVEATLANADALTAELRMIAEQNRYDIAAIVDSVRRLSESLEGYVDDIGTGVDEEVEKLKDLTDHLDEAAVDLASITGKVDRGEGTVGALINDRDTIDRLNEAVDGVNTVVRSFSGLRPQFYYTGRFYMGNDPKDTDTFYYGNPLAWSASNTIGIRLRAHEDFWYLFEINDYPQGVISQEEIYREDTDQLRIKWKRSAAYRFSFQVEKRWGKFSFRLGLREGGGGVGVTAYALRDKFTVNLDVFDFFFGSYPALQDRGIPNVRLGARYEAMPNFYVEAGAEQIILGAKHGFFTGYLGVGFTFTDDDLRWVLQGLPLRF